MDGDALIVEKALDGRGCDADVELAFDQRMRDAVVVALNLNVIVNMYAGFFPFGVFIGFGGQGLESGSFQSFKLRMARAWQFFERLVVEHIEQLEDGGIEIREREESQFAQTRQHPTLDNLYAILDLRLITRFFGARGQGCCVVMFEHFGISPREHGFKTISFVDAAFEIIGLMCPNGLCGRTGTNRLNLA